MHQSQKCRKCYGLFNDTNSTVLKKAKRIYAVSLEGVSPAGRSGKIQPDRRLGSEMSDYAKKCGVGGIFHTDELPVLWCNFGRGHPVEGDI